MFKILLAILLTTVTSQTVPQLDEEKYLGRWYQIYSDIPVDITFENNSYCVTADYEIYPNNTISVLNRERYGNTTGEISSVYGWAQINNETQPGQLTVNLQTAPFPAPYWIYSLGPDTYNGTMYEYSIVSDPLKLTLFVLARNVSEFYEKWNYQVMSTLHNLGFDNFINNPISTVQDGCTY